MSACVIIAVAGGSGSGKTTLAKRLLRHLDPRGCAILGQDNYYVDQSSTFDHDGGSVNFDHPEALEFSLMAKHLQQLKSGHDIDVPIYDFATHKRINRTSSMKAEPFIIVDGTLILSQPSLLPHFDEAVFLDVDEQTRFERRLKRDVEERGRTPEGVREQFYKQVKVMHDQFVEPSKKASSFLIQEDRRVLVNRQRSDFHQELLQILKLICR